MIEYDETLQDLLVKNNFTYANLPSNFNIMAYNTIHIFDKNNEIISNIKSYNNIYKTRNGCIFTLPGIRRDGFMWIYYSELSSKEIRKIIKMKAFL